VPLEAELLVPAVPEVEPVPAVPEVEPVPPVPEPEPVPLPEALNEPLAEPDAPEVPAVEVLSVALEDADEAGGVEGVIVVELDELGEEAGVAVEPLDVLFEGRSQPVAKAAASAKAAATGISFIEFSMDRLDETPAGGVLTLHGKRQHNACQSALPSGRPRVR